MANTKSTQHEIDLTSSLNLNKFKADIKPYNGFNERNAPYYGGCLSPLYMKDEGEQPDGAQFYNGHLYYLDGNQFCKDGESICTVDTDFTVTKKTIPNTDYIDFSYTDDNNYTAITSTSIIVMKDGVRRTTPITTNGLIQTLIGNKLIFIETYNYIRVYRINDYGIVNLVREIRTEDFITLYNKNIIIIDESDVSKFYINGIPCTVSESNVVTLGSIFVSDATDGSSSDGTTRTLFSIQITKNGVTSTYSTLARALRDGDMVRLPICITGYSDGTILFIQKQNNQYDCYLSMNVSSGWTYTVASQPYKKHITSIESVYPKADDYNNLYLLLQDDNDACYFYSSSPYFPHTQGTSNTFKSILHWSVSPIDDVNFPMPPGGYSKPIIQSSEFVNVYLLCTNTGYAQGISANVDNLSESIGTLLTAWGSVDDTKNVYAREVNNSVLITYYDADARCWSVISIGHNTDNINFKIIGDYAVFNTINTNNAVNIKTGKMTHFASDWNNRAFTGSANSGSLRTPLGSSMTQDKVVTEYHHLYSSGQNVNWLEGDMCSTTFAPVTVYAWGDYFRTYPLNAKGGLPIDVYEDWDYKTSIIAFVNYYTYKNVYNSSLIGADYPSEVRYNIPLLFDVITSPYDSTVVRFGQTGFYVMYYDNQIRYQYLASSIADFDIMFIIQGQAYGVARNKIYSISYASNTIQSVQPVTTVEGLQYIGATIYNAYFYSPTARIIYAFGADNNLTVFSQADTFAEITGASYIPATGSILIGVNEVQGETETGCLYVLNERFGIYRINDIDGFKSAGVLADGSVGCLTDQNVLYRLAYEAIDGFTKKDIVLDTAFYGAGSNVVSVNDCWYIRVTDPEHNPGEIKLAVSTLTDIGRQTETRTFKIKATDWDELTDTVYIRFQPKLQRAVGVSLHIESPFKIGYIGVGATPETLQLNKGTI